MNISESSVSKDIHQNIAYYTITWSALFPNSRESIAGAVPSLPGIWELYWLEKSISPRILKMGRAWYGGLRSELRVEADGGERRNRHIREYLNSGDCYYRYTICEVASDLEEIYDVLTSIRGLPGPETAPVKRYTEVRISEPDKMIIHRRRTKKSRDEEAQSREVPNMFDVLEAIKKMK